MHMTISATDLAKRIAAAHKQALGKAAMHLDKAMGAHQAGMASLGKAAEHFVTAKKAGKKDDFPLDEVAGHLTKAAEQFSSMQDHQELAAHNLNKVASSWGAGSGLPTSVSGTIGTMAQSELTEGEVPIGTAGEPFPGKAATLTLEQLLKALTEPDPKDNKGTTQPGFVSETEAKAREEAALLKGKLEGSEKLNETLARMPGSAPRARLFAVDKSAFAGAGGEGDDGADAMSKLMKGVHFDQNDPDSVNRAAATMIGNMIGDTLNGGRTFGRPVFGDPNFHGQAANKRPAAN
jgi:hypothetical protein